MDRLYERRGNNRRVSRSRDEENHEAEVEEMIRQRERQEPVYVRGGNIMHAKRPS